MISKNLVHFSQKYLNMLYVAPRSSLSRLYRSEFSRLVIE